MKWFLTLVLALPAAALAAPSSKPTLNQNIQELLMSIDDLTDFISKKVPTEFRQMIDRLEQLNQLEALDYSDQTFHGVNAQGQAIRIQFNELGNFQAVNLGQLHNQDVLARINAQLEHIAQSADMTPASQLKVLSQSLIGSSRTCTKRLENLFVLASIDARALQAQANSLQAVDANLYFYLAHTLERMAGEAYRPLVRAAGRSFEKLAEVLASTLESIAEGKMTRQQVKNQLELARGILKKAEKDIVMNTDLRYYRSLRDVIVGPSHLTCRTIL